MKLNTLHLKIFLILFLQFVLTNLTETDRRYLSMNNNFQPPTAAPGEYTITNLTKGAPAKVKQLQLFYRGLNEFFAFPWREDTQDLKFSNEPIFKFPSALTELYTSYKAPENIFIMPMTQCNAGASVKIISSSQDLKDSLSASMKATASTGPITLTASMDYSKINQILTSRSSQIKINEEICLTEKVERNKGSSLETEFSDQFITEVKSLPDVVDEKNSSIFFRFLNNFGTHYFNKIIYGAKRVEISEVNKVSKTDKTTENTKLGLDVGAPKLSPVSGSVGGSLGWGKEQTFSDSSEDSVMTKFSLGTFNSKDSSIPLAQADITMPTPIKYDYDWIYNIFDNSKFNKFNMLTEDKKEIFTAITISNFKNNLKNILSSETNTMAYCNFLKKDNPSVMTCEDFTTIDRVVGYKLLYMASGDETQDHCNQGIKREGNYSRATVLEWPDKARPQSFDVRLGFHAHSTKVYVCQIKKTIQVRRGSSVAEDSFMSAIYPPRVVRTLKIAKMLIQDFGFTCNVNEQDKEILTLNGSAPGYDEMILCYKLTNEISDPGVIDLAISVRANEIKPDKNYDNGPKNADFAPVSYETRNNYEVGNGITYYECHTMNINRIIMANYSYICFTPSNWKNTTPKENENQGLKRSKKVKEEDLKKFEENDQKKDSFSKFKGKFKKRFRLRK